MTNSSLVRGKRIFTAMGSDGRWHAIDDAAILQRDGAIVEIGAFQDLKRANPDLEIVGSPQHVILPGFINGHHHVGLTPLQLGSPDLPLEVWIAARLKSRFVDPYLDTLYSAFEMIASGVTTVQHIRAGSIGTIADSERAAHEIIRAYDNVGMRASLSFSARDQNRIVYQDDDEFTRSLPAELQPMARWHLSRFAGSIDEYLALFVSLREKYAANGRVAIQLAPANLHWCSDETLLKYAEISARYDSALHIHLLETPFQKEYGKRRNGKSAFAHIERLGLAGPRLTLGHGVWTCEDDLDGIAATGTHICHNCSSNFRLRSGIAPLNRFIKKKINIGLGIDEAGINDDRDMLQEMRLVLNVHRVPGVHAGDVPSPDQVLHMATAGGAATTPFAGRIGTLEVGRQADLVLIDFDKVAFPYLDPDTPILDAVLHRATRSAVDAVMIAGEVVYAGGKFTRIDRDAILEQLRAHMQRPISEDERKGREFATALVPHVEKFFSNYTDLEAFDPYYRQNARR
jgi:cytosine/adenosine deaminase-related metal-dependent hydrolase